MLIRIGLEKNYEGRVLAWALDFAGCYAYGMDDGEAIMRLPQALLAYEKRIAVRVTDPWVKIGDFDLRIVDTWTDYSVNENYEFVPTGEVINAWFQDDWRPLTGAEIDHALLLARWNREDLLLTTQSLPAELLDQTHPGERMTVRRILKHIGWGAEWWYLERLNLEGMAEEALPSDVFELLAVVRARLEEVLPGLAGKEMVVGKEGEFWSPRKLVRRVLQHEADHIEHILKLLTA
jgi:hypothetical protein